MKRYLILGNGFDLAHNLPTKYIDFLSLCIKYLEDMGIEVEHDFDLSNSENLMEVYKRFLIKYKDDIETIDEIKNNIWIRYFIYFKKAGENWFDFENSIYEVCKLLVKYQDFKEDANYSAVNSEKGLRLRNFEIENDEILNLFTENESRKIEIDKMNKDLIKLKKLLLKYLAIVNKLPINIYYKEILDFNPTNIINFNYTSTFERKYNQVPTDYIHGNLDNKNLVLGMNSIDDGNEVYYSEFLKYYQMICYDIKLNSYYLLQNEDDNNSEIMSMFFGHSLDYNDKDVILDIINKSRIIFICYHSEEGKAQIIKNLRSILNKELFFKNLLSINQKIFFIKEHKIKYAKYELEIIKEINDNTIKQSKIEEIIKKMVNRKKFELGIFTLYKLNNYLKNHKLLINVELLKKLYEVVKEKNHKLSYFEEEIILFNFGETNLEPIMKNINNLIINQINQK